VVSPLNDKASPSGRVDASSTPSVEHVSLFRLSLRCAPPRRTWSLGLDLVLCKHIVVVTPSYPYI